MKGIRVKVLYFAQAREAAGVGREELVLPAEASVSALVAKSLGLHGRLGSVAGSMKVAVNEEIADPDQRLSDGDEVAFLPPVAGG